MGHFSVYPRRCGEQDRRWPTQLKTSGLSPQVRGTGINAERFAQLQRFIPAGAGNRASHSPILRSHPVYPRRCGEQLLILLQASTLSGLSPQVRGTGRHEARKQRLWRFIPAGAGNRPPGSPPRHPRPVYPRRCGEQPSVRRYKIAPSGLSPQVRGTASARKPPPTKWRFIPAGAGNRPPGARKPGSRTVYPRRCGEQHGYPPR